MAREMSEHWAIGSHYLAFGGVLNALLAHNALLAGGWAGPATRVGKEEQPAALHLVPDEPTQILGAGFCNCWMGPIRGPRLGKLRVRIVRSSGDCPCRVEMTTGTGDSKARVCQELLILEAADLRLIHQGSHGTSLRLDKSSRSRWPRWSRRPTKGRPK